MKYIFFILGLLAAISSNAQTTLHIGTDGYVIINGQRHNRNFGQSYYSVSRHDTLLQITEPRGTIANAKCTDYLDGDNANAPFASMAALQVWMDSYFENFTLPEAITSVETDTLKDANGNPYCIVDKDAETITIGDISGLDAGNTVTLDYVHGTFTSTGLIHATGGIGVNDPTKSGYYELPTGGGISGQVLTTFADHTTDWTDVPIYTPLVDSGIFKGRSSATTVVTHTVVGTGNYVVNGYVTVNSINTDVMNVRISWTDDASHLKNYDLPNVSNGYNNIAPVSIRVLDGTDITVLTVLTVSGGTINYDVAATITKQ